MPLVVPTASAAPLLALMWDRIAVYYHLYTNDLDPDLETVLEDLVEATFPGYSAQIVQQWTPPILVGADAASYGDPVLWERSVSGLPQTIYGYYVTAGPTSDLLWAERRAAGPVVVSAAGDPVYLTPALTLQSLTA